MTLEYMCLYFLTQPELLSSLKSPKEVSKILDAEWCGSDRPIIATVDGCVICCDLMLSTMGSALDEREVSGMK